MIRKNYEIIIVGGGPAGLTAGIYAGRTGLKTLILERELPGGRAIKASKIENFPGISNGITGAELMQRMTNQALRFGAEIRFPERVTKIDLSREERAVDTKKGTYQAPALILCTGTQRKELLVPGEIALLGRGVSYCPICDGPFFTGLEVTVVGSDDEAANDAFFLTGIAKKVTMITNNKEMEMSYAWRKKLEEKSGFEIMLNSKVKSIEGNAIVEAVNVLNLKTGKEKRFPTNAVFISVGSVPMTDITHKAGVAVDENGCINVDRRQRTNVEGVFAAGNCTCGGTQIVTAVGEGAKAAIEASTYVKNTIKTIGDKANKKKNCGNVRF